MEEQNNDISFSGKDPGATKYGNFINYYSFHSANERIKNLSPGMFLTEEETSLVCLDIGCNTGELTKALKQYIKKLYPKLTIKILAIDIDQTLIERAKKSNSDDDIDFVCLDIMSESGTETIRKYLSNSCKEYFDIVFCFSVTMWIHLNHGDEGLMKFIHFVASIASILIIEPQPWKCYRTAQRRMTRAGKRFPLYPLLKIRSGVDLVIENTLTESTHHKITQSSLSSWKRKIQSYRLVNY